MNKQKVETLSIAAVCADEFVVPHRAAFPSVHQKHIPVAGVGNNPKIQPKTFHCSCSSYSDS